MASQFGLPARVLGLLVLICLPAFPQLITGSVTGSVQDPSGAAIVGATIKITNTGTGAAQAAASDGAGNFQFLLLPPGVYVLEASNPGFRTFRREGIVVETARSLAVPVVLSLGQVTETIEVAGATPLLESNTSSLGTVMDRMKVEDLPLNGRNPMSLANLICQRKVEMSYSLQSRKVLFRGWETGWCDKLDAIRVGVAPEAEVQGRCDGAGSEKIG